MAKAKKNGKSKAKLKSTVSFKTWATTIARGRGDKARIELNKLRSDAKAFATLAKDEIGQKFPALFANYNKYLVRGSQAKAA